MSTVYAIMTFSCDTNGPATPSLYSLSRTRVAAELLFLNRPDHLRHSVDLGPQHYALLVALSPWPDHERQQILSFWRYELASGRWVPDKFVPKPTLSHLGFALAA